MSMNRGRKRSVRGSRNSTGGTPSKRGRRTSGSVDVPLLPPPEPVPPPRIEVEKPDANMCLKVRLDTEPRLNTIKVARSIGP